MANYQNLPSNPSPHGHYLAQAPDNSYSRRKPPVASLSLHDLRGTGMGMSSTGAVRNEFGGVGTGIAYGAPAPAVLPPGDPSSAFNNSLIKNLSDKRVTKDGQPAKRRGPKPDSKPAMTRRQELNRQAQRYDSTPTRSGRRCTGANLQADHSTDETGRTGSVKSYT